MSAHCDNSALSLSCRLYLLLSRNKSHTWFSITNDLHRTDVVVLGSLMPLGNKYNCILLLEPRLPDRTCAGMIYGINVLSRWLSKPIILPVLPVKPPKPHHQPAHHNRSQNLLRKSTLTSAASRHWQGGTGHRACLNRKNNALFYTRIVCRYLCRNVSSMISDVVYQVAEMVYPSM